MEPIFATRSLGYWSGTVSKEIRYEICVENINGKESYVLYDLLPTKKRLGSLSRSAYADFAQNYRSTEKAYDIGEIDPIYDMFATTREKFLKAYDSYWGYQHAARTNRLTTWELIVVEIIFFLVFRYSDSDEAIKSRYTTNSGFFPRSNAMQRVSYF